MNDAQYQRFRKMNTESNNINCLFHAKDKKGNPHFLITGSTGTRYRVSFYLSTGKVHCSCPDNKHNRTNEECICKHSLYVIYNILKLFDDVDHSFFERLYFTPDEIDTIRKLYARLPQNKALKNI